MSNVSRQNMPLFKYLHPDRTDVLRGQSIRFTSPAALNDPFELKPHLATLASPEYMAAELNRAIPRVLEEELAKVPSELRQLVPAAAVHALLQSQLPEAQCGLESMAALLMPRLQQAMARKFEELIGVLCLSESADSLLMWAHYADSHRGFVLEFDEGSPFFDCRVGQDDELRHLRKVTYSQKRPSLALADVEDFSAFMTKGTDWEYEAEWRMIVTLDSASRILGGGAEAIHLFNFPAEAVTSVVFGCRMLDSKKAEIRQLLSESKRYRHVRCVEAEISEEHYRVTVPRN